MRERRAVVMASMRKRRVSMPSSLVGVWRCVCVRSWLMRCPMLSIVAKRVLGTVRERKNIMKVLTRGWCCGVMSLLLMMVAAATAMMSEGMNQISLNQMRVVRRCIYV